MPSQNNLFNLLRANKLFEEFSDKQIALVTPYVHEIEVASGEFIIHEKDVHDFLYIIESGEIEVCQFNENEGLYHTLVILKDGEILGEIASIDHEPRSASARALEHTVLLKLSLDDIETISKENPLLYSRFIFNLSKIVVKRLRDSNETVVQLLKKDLENMRKKVIISFVVIGSIVFLIIIVALIIIYKG